MAPENARNDSDSKPPDTATSNDVTSPPSSSEYDQNLRADAESDDSGDSQAITDWASI